MSRHSDDEEEDDRKMPSRRYLNDSFQDEDEESPSSRRTASYRSNMSFRNYSSQDLKEKQYAINNSSSSRSAGMRQLEDDLIAKHHGMDESYGQFDYDAMAKGGDGDLDKGYRSKRDLFGYGHESVNSFAADTQTAALMAEKDPFEAPSTFHHPTIGMGQPLYDGIPEEGYETYGQEGINTPGIEAFVADQPVDATGVAVVMSEEEEEQLEQTRQKRLLIYGFVSFLVLAIVVIVVVATVFGRAPEPDPVVPTSFPSVFPSQVPSFAPTTTRLDSFIQAFIPFSGTEVFQNRSSPQFLAAEWIADFDELQLPVSAERAHQRYALAVFYFAMQGDGWVQCGRSDPTCGGDPDERSWLLDKEHECIWLGVDCTEGDTGNVRQIFFARQLGNNLIGTLPPELTMMTDMWRLIMQRNRIHGTIPTFLGQMTNLVSLFFLGCEFTGTIPAEVLQGASLLGTIHFGENNLVGSIPSLLGQLPLRTLHLAENFMNGTIPSELGLNTQMTYLELQNNDFEGSIPTELFQATALNRLRLYDNDLTGTISPMFVELANLEDLRIGNNFFSGTIPEEIYEIPGLVDFRAEDNNIRGTISPLIGDLNATIRRYFVSNNEMTGTLPLDAIHMLTNLNTLVLHSNDFSGSISATVCDEKGSRFFDLQNLTVPPTVNCSVRSNCCDLVA